MPKSAKIRGLRLDYQRLCRQLARSEWICQGSVMKRSYQRPAGNGLKTYGPYYSWTRKVANKTVTVALSLAQYYALQSAIAQHRRLEGVLDRMRRLSEKVIFATTLGVLKRSR
ncbi:MAG: hypothetical protein KKG09_06855 [Verrucomicrobia bacterium]|nr:hypothetical protein [Verrucomicrobiota bacterium]MBU4291378.1 hypothetical protein [Verrucomicrobiota bacterium]MBU4497702.1 hypothetical protein [Verrucomicrobiota bacterium]MCG2679857.1 hypothetical protein [Kiritimatiellia bacterium]